MFKEIWIFEGNSLEYFLLSFLFSLFGKYFFFKSNNVDFNKYPGCTFLIRPSYRYQTAWTVSNLLQHRLGFLSRSLDLSFTEICKLFSSFDSLSFELFAIK